MKSLMSLWRELALEWASWCCTSADRDIQKAAVRVESEGESFLTITLPKFAKAFHNALETGSIDSRLFSGFHCSAGIPEFLRGFLSQIFDTSGTLLDVPSVDCIKAVRHLTMVFGKIETEYSEEDKARAMQRYVEIEAELEGVDSSSFEEFLPLYLRASTLLWADVFSHVENSLLDTHHLAHDWDDCGADPYKGSTLDRIHSHNEPRAIDSFFLQSMPDSLRVGFQNLRVDLCDCKIVDPANRFMLVPRHGPGATADRLRGNAKFSISKWPLRLEFVLPYGEYALPSWRSYDQLDRVEFLEPGAEVPVKVTSVPKTPKTPRIISEETAAVQYCQQALAHQFIDACEEHIPTTPSWRREKCDLGRFFVGFKEQEPNRLLALRGSLDGSLATLI
jgi:hypothetical protein